MYSRELKIISWLILHKSSVPVLKLSLIDVVYRGCEILLSGWCGDLNKEYQPNIGAGGTIVFGKVASSLVSNDSLEMVDETRG
jgi:hypothetical protein